MDQKDTTNMLEHDPITVPEIASIAKTMMEKEVWDYYACGADDQTALRENEAAFKAWVCHPLFLPCTFLS